MSVFEASGLCLAISRRCNNHP